MFSIVFSVCNYVVYERTADFCINIDVFVIMEIQKHNAEWLYYTVKLLGLYNAL